MPFACIQELADRIIEREVASSRHREFLAFLVKIAPISGQGSGKLGRCRGSVLPRAIALQTPRCPGKVPAGRHVSGRIAVAIRETIAVAKIEGLRVANYRVLKAVTLGKLWNTGAAKPLTPVTAVIGKNGVGKSCLFDAFGFLADCLKLGVEEACGTRERGGFNRIRSQGSAGPIRFEIHFRQRTGTLPITYDLDIDADSKGRPYVARECLRQRRKGQKKYDTPFSFLAMRDGRGVAWKGNTPGRMVDEGENAKFNLEELLRRLHNPSNMEESTEMEPVELQDKRRLGIATLGALKQHPRIAAFRQFIEGWHLSYFTPDAARSIPLAGPQKHLKVNGDNLSNVVQFMELEHRDRFAGILKKIAERIPGIDRIETERSSDGRLLLRFNDKGFVDPFYAQQMSDGTLKAFAYLLMLEDPAPPPFICIEEPENGLHHKLLEFLAGEFRACAAGRKNAPQIFVTTHQPYFVDALRPDEVWILEKGEDGFSTIRLASDDKIVRAMVDEGLPLGGLWYNDYLD